MYTLLTVVIIICLLCGRPGFSLSLPTDGSYISRERTCLINGVFIWCVFASHIFQYGLDLTGTDKVIMSGVRGLQQCMVSTFFMFSGFGIMNSLLRKGDDYARTLISVRYFSLLVHFSIAVLVYVLIQYCIGKTYTFAHVLAAFPGWSPVGASCWFIFITLTSYWLIAISYWLCRKISPVMVAICVVLMFAALIPAVMHRGLYVVDSCLCIPAGMLYRVYQKEIERIVRACRIPVAILGGALIYLGLIIYKLLINPDVVELMGRPTLLSRAYVQNVGCIVFAVGVLWLFAAFRFNRTPRFLVWCGGSALFYIYVFQRIPMLLGQYWKLNQYSTILYSALCIIITLVLAWFACRIFPRLNTLIFPQKKSAATPGKEDTLGESKENGTPDAISSRTYMWLVIFSMVGCLGASFQFWIPQCVEVTMKYSVQKPIALQCFYTETPRGKWLFTEKEKVFGEGAISFLLPTKELARFRLDIGEKPGKVEIKDLCLRGSQTISLASSTMFVQKNMAKVTDINNGFQLYSSHNDPFMVYNKPFCVQAGDKRSFLLIPFAVVMLGACVLSLFLREVIVAFCEVFRRKSIVCS